MIGPGEYDEICTIARIMSKAQGVVLLVLGGSRGSGFSIQAPYDLSSELPGMLREIANAIEKDLEKGGEGLVGQNL